jgi:hypothetical protein
MNRRPTALITLLALLLLLASCKKSAPYECPPHPKAETTEASAALLPKKAVDNGRSLDQIIPPFLPENAHAVAFVPALAHAEKVLQLGHTFRASFSADRRGLRSFGALDSIGASLDSPDSWKLMGISPQTGLFAALIDSNTLVLGLRSDGVEASLPKWVMAITLLTGKAPKTTLAPNGITHIQIGGPRVWALAKEDWVLLVLTSGSEEPTEKALALCTVREENLANHPGFKRVYPSPAAGTLFQAYVNTGQLLHEEVNDLRAPKHGSWIYAEKLLATAIRQDKPERVISHWRTKVDGERAWSKKNRPGLLSAADVLEKTYGGLNAVGIHGTLRAYGLGAELDFHLEEGSLISGLFPKVHPGEIAGLVPSKNPPEIWVAGTLDPHVLASVVEHVSTGSFTDFTGVLKKAADGPLGFSIAADSAPDGPGGAALWKTALLFNGLEESKIAGLKRHLNAYLTHNFPGKKPALTYGKNSVFLAMGEKSEKYAPRTLEQEGRALLVGEVQVAALHELFETETKTIPSEGAAPMKAAIIEEMNSIRKNRDLELSKERARLMESLGTLSFRFLPLKTGVKFRADVVAEGALSGAAKSWVSWLEENNKIEASATEKLTEKRQEMRDARKGEAPSLP